MDQDSEKARVYRANFMLQQKVGSGPLDEETVKKCQTAIDNNEVDFTPLGLQYLGNLQEAINKAKSPDTDIQEAKQLLTQPVMELKANATFFHYSLIGNLANIMLSFLESIDQLDKDAVDIVEAHHKTLHAIIIKKMAGDGGEHGAIMVKELKDACARYYAKRTKKK